MTYGKVLEVFSSIWKCNESVGCHVRNFSLVEGSYGNMMVAWLGGLCRANTIASPIYFVGVIKPQFLI